MIGKALKAAAFVMFFGATSALASPLCDCQDWDGDGRYGVVLEEPGQAPKVVQSNVGSYAACNQRANTLRQCRVTPGYCACEDWNHDGYFGLVKYYHRGGNKLLIPNYGSKAQCQGLLNRHPRC